jgi:hypothetical protein
LASEAYPASNRALSDGRGDADGAEAGAAGLQQRVQRADVDRVVVQQHRQDDLAVVGQGLQVAGAHVAAGLGRHDPAVRVGGVALGDVALVRVGQRALQRRAGAFLLGPGGADLRRLVHRLGRPTRPAADSAGLGLL